MRPGIMQCVFGMSVAGLQAREAQHGIAAASAAGLAAVAARLTAEAQHAAAAAIEGFATNAAELMARARGKVLSQRSACARLS